jgi:hypothetical protein
LITSCRVINTGHSRWAKPAPILGRFRSEAPHSYFTNRVKSPFDVPFAAMAACACMKIYKYRDFSNPNEDDFRRLEASVYRHLVWCAKPDRLNDPQEFVWECDYTATPATLDLLTEVLVKVRGRTQLDARVIAEVAIQRGRLESIAKPVFIGMIEQCRNEIGLSCFGAAPNNEILWQRYGGNGAGVCVEFEVPADMLGTQVHWVQYPEHKRLHVDQLMHAFVDRNHV